MAMLLLAGSMLAPSTLFAQPLTVLGGNSSAAECYENASLAAELPAVSNSMIQPCDYALELVNLGVRDRAATFANRGILRMARGDIEAALNDYETALDISPDTAEILVNRGNAWFMTGDFGLAMGDYETALARGINQMDRLYFNIGLTHERLNNTDAAETAYRQALALSPGWAVAQNRLDRMLESRTADQPPP